MSKTKKPSTREPGVNEITQIAHQAGEQIRQMKQQEAESSCKGQLGSTDATMRALFGAEKQQG